MFRALAIGWLSVTAALLPSPAGATTLNEIRIGMRIIDFLANPPRGPTQMSILFDGQNKLSREDAETILAGVRESQGVTKSALYAVMQDVRQLDGASTAPIAFLAAGTEPFYGQIFEVAQRTGMLTMSADQACVEASKCAVGINSLPRVEVTISQAAARACHVVFTDAFRMMVSEK